MDASLATLAEINNPNLYKVKEGVPTFRPHRRKTKDASGRDEEIVVTEKTLEEIVRNMLEREEENGVCGRITDGHIIPQKNVPEKDQPNFLGYMKNPRVGTFGKKKIPCILTDHHIALRKLPIAEERKFRSAEYYPNAKDITGCALMIRDPFLDLGVVDYAGQHSSLYARDDTPYLYTMTDNDGDTAMADMPMAGTKDQDDEPLPAEEAQHYAKFCGYAKRWAKGNPKLYSLLEGAEAPAAPAPGPAAPAAGNTNLPAALKPEEDATLNAKNTDPVLYARLEAAEKRVADLLMKDERNAVSGVVDKLAIHYRLDRETEITNLLAKTSKEREAHINYIKATHAPQDQQIQIYSGNSEGGTKTPTTTKEIGDMAVMYSSEKNITYDEALIEVRDNGKRPKGKRRTG